MTKQDYRNSISAPISATDAYDKIAQVDAWWAKDFTGSARHAGDKFTVRFGETFVDFRIAEAVPGQRVVWDVTNCWLPWLADKTEWNGTDVVFEIATHGPETTVTMTHEGLIPGIECYGDCEQGWNQHISGSLKQFLAGGQGAPQGD